MNILFTTQHGNFLSVIMHVYHSLKNLDIALDHPYEQAQHGTEQVTREHRDASSDEERFHGAARAGQHEHNTGTTIEPAPRWE